MKNSSTQTLTAIIDKNTTHRVANIIQIKVDRKNKSAAGQLSARPSRSFFKSKSLVKPLIGKLEKR